MRHSESQSAIAPALVAALGQLTNPPKTANNPFFKSKYAPLDGTLDLIRGVLAKNGLAMTQATETGEDGHPAVITRITHESGEWLESGGLVMKPVKEDPQGFGSALTYARRYSLQAMLGITGEADDDANASSATGKPTPAKPTPAKPKPAPTAEPPSVASTRPEPAGSDRNAPLGFGKKHADKPMCLVPEDYLQWIVASVDKADVVERAAAELAARAGESAPTQADPEPDDRADETELQDEDLPF